MIVGGVEVQLRSTSDKLRSDFVSDLQATSAVFDSEGRQRGQDFSTAFRQGVDLKPADFDEVGRGAKPAGDEAGDQFNRGFEDKAKPDGGGLIENLRGLGGKAGAGMLAGFAAVGVGAGIAGILTTSVAAAIDMSAATDKLAAQLGITTETDIKALGETAGKVYAGAFGENLDQVNEAIRSVSQNLSFDSQESLQHTTEQVLNLASAFDVDLNSATASASQLIRTGLAGSAGEAFDLITAGFQGGIDKAGDFLDTLNEYSTQFRKLGIEGPEALGLMAQGLQAGARDSDIVADAIKEFSIRAIDGSKLTAQGFKGLGLSAKEMSEAIASGGPKANAALDTTLDRLRAVEDPVKRSQLAVALFGTQAEDLGQALFALDVTTAADSIGKVGGAADAMGKTLNDNAASNIESFKRQVQLTFVDVIGGQVLPVVDQAASALATGFAPALAAVKDAADQAGSGGGPFAGIVSGAHDFVDNIMPALAPAGEALAKFGRDLLGPLSEVGQKILNEVGPALSEIGSIIGDQLLPAFTAVLPVLEPVAAFLIETIGGAVVGALHGAINVIEGALKIITGILQVFTGVFTGDWSKVWDGVKNIFSGAFQAILGLVQFFFNTGLLKVFRLGFDVIRGVFSGSLQIIGAVFDGALTGLGKIAESGLSSLLALFKALPARIVSGLGNLLGLLRGAGGDVVEGFRNAITTAFPKVISFLAAIPGKILHIYANAGTLLLDAGKAIIEGLLNGIKAAAGRVGDVVSGIAGGIKSKFTGLLGIASPSKVFAEYGRNIVEGLVKGIVDDSPEAERVVDRLAKSVAAKYKSATDALKAAQDARNSFASSVTNAAIGQADIFAGDQVTAASIAGSFKSQIADVTKFLAVLTSLKAAGINDAIFQQLANLGPDKGFAPALSILASGAGGIKEINDLQAQLAKQASQLGSSAAKDLYGAGVNAAQGLVEGIKSQRQALLEIAADMGRSVAAKVKEELKIKSPSQVFAGIGDEIPAGLALGIDRSSDLVSTASVRMANAALFSPAAAQLDKLAAAQARATVIGGVPVQQAPSAGRTNIYQIDATNMTPAELRRELESADQLDAVLHPGSL